jgi:hypothetical protein
VSKARKRFTEKLRTRWRNITNFVTREQAFADNGGVASGGAVIDAQGFISRKTRAFDPVSRLKGVVDRPLTSKTQPTGWEVPGNTAEPSVALNVEIQDTTANILARSGDAVGVIAFATSGANQYNLMVYDGANWQIYENS